ncbi:MAG: PQQ-dependent sugar dehydrogenase [Bacteroidetes bacterium]|nr:PQQ-dependent sugar dehydrogenase [Bacteroidota bacterium]
MKRAYAIIRLIFCLYVFPVTLFAQNLPAGFSISDIGSDWNQAIGAAFTKDGKKIFVWEKAGKVYVCNWDATSQTYIKQATPVLNISPEVGDWRDHGLLGFTLDPNFDNNGLIYLLYVVDRHYLMNYGTAAYSDATDDYYKATIGRVTRYKTMTDASGLITADLSTRNILIGETKTSGIPILYESHGMGSLVFASDGTLLVSAGDAASYDGDDTGSLAVTYYQQALADGIIRPEENVGAFRAQMINCLNGKILRIDPVTGNGIPSNPFYLPAQPRAARSRVWTIGLRNPYRITVKPNSGSTNPATGDLGEIYVGDVGFGTFEEINIINKAGQNCGWPVYEGLTTTRATWGSYSNYPASAKKLWNRDEPNPLYGTSSCTQPYFYFGDLLKEATADGNTTVYNPCNPATAITSSNSNRFVHHRPAIDWIHSSLGPDSARIGIFNGNTAAVAQLGSPESGVEGNPFTGFCTVGGVWYTGTTFPAQYQNTFFFADYANHWINVLTMKNSVELQKVEKFADNFNALVFLTQNPMDGSLVVIDYYSSLGTRFYKISYGGNQVPVVKMAADKIYGPSALAVNFTGSNSFDPEGAAISYAWDFGDGSTSTTANPSHSFTAPANTPTKFVVKLTVKDNLNLTSTDSIIISVNNTPPVVSITSPVKNSKYRAGAGDTTYTLRATVTDAEQTDGQLHYEWQAILHHNTHQHEEPADTNRVTSAVISRIGCNGDSYYFMIVLTVTDAAGLSTSDSARLFPACAGDPIALDSFIVEKQGTINAARWTTENEANSKYYILERKTGGGEFQAINQQNGRNVPGRQSYAYNDAEYSKAVNFYRLKLVADDDSYFYSDTIQIDNRISSGLSILPNPVHKELILSANFPETGPLMIRIIDMEGRVMQQISKNVNSGPNTLTLTQLQLLRAGTYVLEVRQKNYQEIEKFVKMD